MLRTYSNSISVTSGNAIPLNKNKILTNTSISHAEGSSSIVVNSPGYYLITVDTSSTIDTTGTASIQLYANGTAIPDAIITENLTASEYSSGSFSTIIKATPGLYGQKVTLTIVPTANLTISSIAVGINRLA